MGACWEAEVRLCHSVSLAQEQLSKELACGEAEEVLVLQTLLKKQKGAHWESVGVAAGAEIPHQSWSSPQNVGRERHSYEPC